MTIDVCEVQEYPHAVEKVWAALTDSVALAQWLMPNDFEPRLGKSFILRGSAPSPSWRGWVDCAVLELEPPSRMVWSWHSTDDGEPTKVEFKLERIQEGSRLTLTHTGDTNPIMHQMLSKGWPERLRKLREELES